MSMARTDTSVVGARTTATAALIWSRRSGWYWPKTSDIISRSLVQPPQRGMTSVNPVLTSRQNTARLNALSEPGCQLLADQRRAPARDKPAEVVTLKLAEDGGLADKPDPRATDLGKPVPASESCHRFSPRYRCRDAANRVGDGRHEAANTPTAAPNAAYQSLIYHN
jgi:hypothetical protein